MRRRSLTPPAVVAANLRITKPLSEVIRLAQSGVDEFVILTYITNSTTLFALGAEEIVYLNDLGVTSPVVTAMMHRDQSLKSAWAAVGQVAPQPPTNQETVAAAPTYVNPPQVAPAPVQEAQPVYVSNDYFYDTLSPYGTWVEVDGYGRVWRPTVAINTSGWQPYRDRGRWVHTDAGWYWMSDYSWGSVAFHYGRWFSHPRWGWCWWPDTQWAPSWVTWRYDNDNCGWAPLPPRSYFRPGVGFSYYDRHVGVDFDFGLSVGAFTFVPWNRFCDPVPVPALPAAGALGCDLQSNHHHQQRCRRQQQHHHQSRHLDRSRPGTFPQRSSHRADPRGQRTFAPPPAGTLRTRWSHPRRPPP
jgi:hypothetical protein